VTLRLSGSSGHLADGDQRELHTRLSESHTITSMDADALLHPLSVYERAKSAVIEQNHLVAVVRERAVSARDPGQAIWECDVARRDWNGSDTGGACGWRARQLRGTADDQ
jgi:hypothetical protein